MKRFIRNTALAIALLAGSMTVSAQEVNTLYFLENSPQRSFFNPALMPVSSGYIVFTPLGYTSLWAGNNSLALNDLVYTKNGQTITALNQGETAKFLKKFHNNNLISADLTTTILGFGARTNKGGYFHGGIYLRLDAGLNIPKKLTSAMVMPDGIGLDMTRLNMSGLNFGMQAYTEIMGGYTRPLNDQWTLGGKLKILIGLANARVNVDNLTITPDQNDPTAPARLRLAGNMSVATPGFIDPTKILPAEGEGMFENIDQRVKNMIPSDFSSIPISQLIKPAGIGAAIDFGFTWKPIKYLQISAAINDLGFIYWMNGVKGTVKGDMEFDGIGEIQVKEKDGKIDTEGMKQQAQDHIQGYLDQIQGEGVAGGYARMTRAHLNVGIDGLFWENRVGLGILSQTKLYNNKIYEELTLGGFFRPVNWFNLAVSYSLINGHGGTIGAALGFAPYDGIMLTLATDYIPCSYADMSPLTNSTKPQYYLPYKNPGVNVALGFAIVWGTNKKHDSDKDGVLDNLDVCPKTPRNIRVDAMGCPLDTDGDGIPDYIDECPNTVAAADGTVDASGCERDGDLDGVPDYLDLCPETPEEARTAVDENGCTRDTDKDGVPDYRDDCPNTLPEAAGFVDEHGCDKDSDGDGVPDYLDKCPNTPEEAYNFINEQGCPLDTDEDGVPDYMDKCPRTVYAARQHVDSCGCDKDTDRDGMPDYLDECPYVPGVKENKGCPQVKRAVSNILKKAMTGIQFETGKATILKKSYPILDEVAKVFLDNPDYIIEVQGHTDNVGNAEANRKLSDKRAHAVRDYIVKKGVDGNRITANGYGDTVPIADNKTKAGRAKNRRVEFKITFEEIHYEIINDHNPGADEPAAQNAAEPAQGK